MSVVLAASSSSSAPAGASDGKGVNLPFDEVCKCFEFLSAPTTNGRSRIPALQLLWDKFGFRAHPLFELVRLMLPHLDTMRPQYRLKQKSIAKMYVEILAINPSSEDAQALLNWKKPASGFQRNEQGNFPEVVLSVIEHRARKRADIPKRLTIGELNALLDKLADEEGHDAKRDVLRQVMDRSTAREQRWILRVVLKDMQIGMKEDSVFRHLHPDAKELYNSVCDLKLTCEKCADPEYRHEAISLCPFKPMRPRLAARADWNTLHKTMSKHGEYVAEDKLDGERLMLHFRRGDPARGGVEAKDCAVWFTRNCKNFSSNYGEAMEPVLRRCLGPTVRECILDGEMMVWNLESGRFSDFGENRGLGDHKKRMDKGQQPCYVVFDCLWLNGQCIDKRPLWERRAMLEPHVRWEDHSMEISKQTVIRPSPPEVPNHTMAIMQALDRAMALGYEGVMFKSSNSLYVAGARDTEWMKLKPDYIHDMGDELDLLIIAGYYGEGQRRGGAISHFLLGVQAPSYERHRHGETEHPRFYPFCKVGSGYTHQQLHSLRDDLKRGQHSWHKHSRPAHLCGWTPNKTDDEPDVWFEPSKSKVMAVAAYEIVKGGPNAPFLPCGYTLRFPRCSCIRHDKQWDDTVTHEEVLARFNDGKAKIAASKRTAADVAAANPDDLHAALKEAAAAKESELFRDHIVVVRGFGSNDASHPCFPANLQSLVARHGGTVHANVTPETTLLVSADDPPGVLVNGDVARARTERWGHCDVVTSSYLLESVERGALVDPEPRFTLYAKPFTRDVIAARMDQWGDRYDEPATMEGLRRAMALVRRDACDGTCAAVRAALSQSRVEAYEAGGSAGVSPWLVSEAWLDACEEAGAHVEERPHALQEARHAAPA